MIKFSEVKIGDVITISMNDKRLGADQWIETPVLGKTFKGSRELQIAERITKRGPSENLIVDLSGANFYMADQHDFTMLTFERRAMVRLGGHNDSSLITMNSKGLWDNWGISVTFEQGEAK